MAKQMGKRAIVIGAGIGGMLFARVLADYFEGVTVLERDSLPDNDEPRNGVPQGRHFHGLLAGGCRAMNALLPGLVDDFKAAGAVELVTGLSSRMEMPGYDPFPHSALTGDAALMRRIQTVMAEMAQAEMVAGTAV